jgi:hypothetical protein
LIAAQYAPAENWRRPMNYSNLFKAFENQDRYGDVGKALRARNFPGVSNLMAVINRPSPSSRFAPLFKSMSELVRGQRIAVKSVVADAAAEKAEARRIMPQLIETANQLAASGRISSLDAAKLDIRIAAAARELE